MLVMFFIISITGVIGRNDLKFVFLRCVPSNFRHFLMGMLVYREDMSKLFMVLFFISVFFSLFKRFPDIYIYIYIYIYILFIYY